MRTFAAAAAPPPRHPPPVTPIPTHPHTHPPTPDTHECTAVFTSMGFCPATRTRRRGREGQVLHWASGRSSRLRRRPRGRRTEAPWCVWSLEEVTGRLLFTHLRSSFFPSISRFPHYKQSMTWEDEHGMIFFFSPFYPNLGVLGCSLRTTSSPPHTKGSFCFH